MWRVGVCLVRGVTSRVVVSRERRRRKGSGEGERGVTKEKGE